MSNHTQVKQQLLKYAKEATVWSKLTDLLAKAQERVNTARLDLGKQAKRAKSKSKTEDEKDFFNVYEAIASDELRQPSPRTAASTALSYAKVIDREFKQMMGGLKAAQVAQAKAAAEEKAKLAAAKAAEKQAAIKAKKDAAAAKAAEVKAAAQAKKDAAKKAAADKAAAKTATKAAPKPEKATLKLKAAPKAAKPQAEKPAKTEKPAKVAKAPKEKQVTLMEVLAEPKAEAKAEAKAETVVTTPPTEVTPPTIDDLLNSANPQTPVA